MPSNCLFWAIWKRIVYGGKLGWEKATRWKGFHVTWTDKENKTWEYIHPRSLTEPSHYLPWWKAWTLILYFGIVRRVR